jgi:Flp pilus assembly protein TadG
MRRATKAGPRGRRDGGQITVMALGLAIITLAVAGLAIDGTRAFLLRRTLQNAADASALAGSGGLDSTAYYSSGGGRIQLEPAAARRAAIELLTRRGVDAQAVVRSAPDGVDVTLRGQARTTFLSLVGIGAVPVVVEARAQPVAGEP